MRIVGLVGTGLMLAACGAGADEGSTQPAAGATVQAQGDGIAGVAQGDGRRYDARDFTGVGAAGPDDVSIEVGPDFAVTATGDREVLDVLVIRVADDMLRIERRPNSRTEGNARIRVTLPRLLSAALAGSGDMQIGRVEGNGLSVATSGAGDIDIDRVHLGGSFDANIAGSGSIEVAGTAQAVNISLMGSGDFDGDDLTAQQSQVSVMGSGDVSLRVDGPANLSSLGSGDITVTGTARCTVSRAGSGQIRCP